MNYELHPLCTLFPRMVDDAFDALVADIRANGLRQPIILHDDMILDGGNRYRACLAAGVTPHFERFEGGNLVSFVLSANLHRRHMSAGQQAAIVAAAQDWAKAHVAGSNQYTAKSGAAILPDLSTTDGAAILPDHDNDPFATVADRAAAAGASERTQRMADKVARTDPKLAKQVAQGKITLPQAVEKISGKRPGAKAKTEREQTADDAFGDADVVAELERAMRDIREMREQLDALAAADQGAELLRQIELRQSAEARLGQEMEKVAQLDKQLRRFGKFCADLRKVTGTDSNAAALEAVRGAFARAA